MVASSGQSLSTPSVRIKGEKKNIMINFVLTSSLIEIKRYNLDSLFLMILLFPNSADSIITLCLVPPIDFCTGAAYG